MHEAFPATLALGIPGRAVIAFPEPALVAHGPIATAFLHIGLAVTAFCQLSHLPIVTCFGAPGAPIDLEALTTREYGLQQESATCITLRGYQVRAGVSTENHRPRHGRLPHTFHGYSLGYCKTGCHNILDNTFRFET